jgi:hypothetical protein
MSPKGNRLLDNFKKFVIGWFIIQCWLTCVACAAAVLLLLGVFGEERIDPTLTFLQNLTGIHGSFLTPLTASVILGIVGLFFFFAQMLIEKYLFRIITVVFTAAIIVWILIQAA